MEIMLTEVGIPGWKQATDGVNDGRERFTTMLDAVRTNYAEAERSEEHTSELQSLMRISYAVFCLKKKTNIITTTTNRLLEIESDREEHTKQKPTDRKKTNEIYNTQHIQ